MESGIKKGPYAVVTLAYWAFTLTDGALRMLVLLYLHQLGRSPLEIAGLFLFYEFFGVVTNLVGGGLAARFGLRWTLISGLVLQVLALGALGFLAEDLNLVWVMGLQSLSGVAKDLTKMSSKSFMKFLVHPEDSGGLLKVVSWLTGSKNTLKGVGFFVGGALLGGLGFAWACWAMALTLVGILAGASWLLPKAYGKAASKGSWTGWWTRDKRVLWLSLSRLALFAARDVWFVLALPLYLTAQLGWSQGRVGGFLALWVIGYGMVQALAPGWIGRRSGRPGALGLLAWTLALWAPL
ncbi:MAG TPA: MFS transporter, partial [Planctomycetota bacterium]|nr:MFS transporter [Planctomycetota bacterium]